MRLELSTAPSGDVVTVADLRSELRLGDITDYDNDLSLYQEIAVEELEADCRLQLLTATWKLLLNRFPCNSEDAIEIPLAPVQSVSSIQYYDTTGVLQTWLSSNYDVSDGGFPTRISTAGDGTAWPSTELRPDAAIVTFVAGYGTSQNVPAMAKGIIRMKVRERFHDCDCGDMEPLLNKLRWDYSLNAERIRHGQHSQTM